MVSLSTIRQQPQEVFIVIITFPTQMIQNSYFESTFAPPLAIKLQLPVNFLPLVIGPLLWEVFLVAEHFFIPPDDLIHL